MSTTLTKTTGGTVVAIDINNLNVDAALGALDRATAKAGLNGGGGGKRLFPGKSIFFKKTGFRFGQGKDAPEIEPPRLVMNFPHLAMAYLKFETGETGKIFPRYSELCIPMLGQDLVDRDSLGDLDQDDWDEMEGRPIDPWTLQVVIPCREADATEYNHVVATNVTNQNVLSQLFRECLAEAKLRPGMLPVVQFSTREIVSEKKEKDKKGKMKTVRREWSGMGYEIVEWVKATPVDQLNQNIELGVDADDNDQSLPAATVKTRTPAIEHKPADTGTKAKAKKKSAPADL